MGQNMKGFDPKFRDFPDYIIGITKEIWEDRGIHTLHDYYSKDIVVRSPGSVVIGNEDVIGATMATLHEFPDRVLLGEDVIWSGTPETGMLSSHRLLSMATHMGDGVYGKATGKKLIYRIHADCHAKDNTIDDEWLVRDQGAIVRQLGWEPKDYAADLIEREGGVQNCVKPLTPETDRPGPYSGTGNDSLWGERLSEILERIMGADMSTIPVRIRPRLSPGLSRRHHRPWPRGGGPVLDGPARAFPKAEFKLSTSSAGGRDDVAPRRRPLEPLGQAHRLGRLWCAHRRDGVCSGHHPCGVRALGPAPRVHAF
jgi:hypothetical protein